jgi:hypothetical protein
MGMRISIKHEYLKAKRLYSTYMLPIIDGIKIKAVDISSTARKAALMSSEEYNNIEGPPQRQVHLH